MTSSERKHNTEMLKERFIATAGLIGTFGAGAFTGPKTEKLALTMSAAELQQVDLLVEHGLYASRESFLETAARNLLREHGVDLQHAAENLTVAGIVMHSRKSLEKLRAAGRQLDVNVAGIFRLSDDVTPELACAVIQSLKVCGAFHASAEVKAALKDRIH
ncbi:MAG: CopG family transcriptional regulator [Acidobacteriia bacterium]|nr:CopG family transcriptional regulator [Terriglobia bacterium]